MSRILLLLACLLTFPVAAQQLRDNVYVYGLTKDYGTGAPLTGAWVVVQRDGVKVDHLVTDSLGRYEVYLDYDHVYTLFYMQGGKVGKHIRIDLSDIPAEARVGGHGMNVNVTLFNAYPCFDAQVLDEPIGQARYSTQDSVITWDLAYTESIRARVVRAMAQFDSLRTAGGCP
jgi:hypothetical protein